MPWAIPFVILFTGLGYGILFWMIAKTAQTISSLFTPHSSLLVLSIKASGLLIFSYIHPFGFDWMKPELIFVESYLGIEKWQFAIILFAIVLAHWRKNLLFLLLITLAYQAQEIDKKLSEDIALVTTHTSVEAKWDQTLHPKQFASLFKQIDQAIDTNKTLVVLPESVFPVFINRSQTLIDTLQEKAKHIAIVTGGLYWDQGTPHNSTYIFSDGKVTVANKVVLVPFGESNPLPDFLSDWINKIFYDGAVDYVASKEVIDYTIHGRTYRNAICFEATSEKLYEGVPKQMIVLSNNGWFTPSTEPALQQLLLKYYSKKYGTTIYHSVNMSKSYIIQNGIDVKDFK